VLGVEGDKIAFKLKTGDIARFSTASISSASRGRRDRLPRRDRGDAPPGLLAQAPKRGSLRKAPKKVSAKKKAKKA